MIQFIHFEEAQWTAYRRALRQEDRELFDALWRYVRHFAVSSQMANRAIPFESLLVSMILGINPIWIVIRFLLTGNFFALPFNKAVRDHEATTV